MGVVFQKDIEDRGALSCPRSGDRVGGTGSGKHSCVKVTLIILSGPSHGRCIFVHIRLVHFTLQEHFLNDSALPHSSHSAIAEVCLTYLNFGSVRELSPTLDSAPSSLPLLEYASVYWGVHARWGMTEKVKVLVRKFSKIRSKHISTQLLASADSKGRVYCAYFEGKEGLTRYTGLGQVKVGGTIYAIAAICESMEEGVNAANQAGNSALISAARKGQEAVVQMLLDRGDVDPNGGDTDRWTPLTWAALMGYEGIIKLLLAQEDVNPNQSDIKHGRTPISWAAMMGHEGAVKIFLEREDVNPDQPDTKYGRTPLSWAAGEGHEGVVKLLLEREDVNPNSQDTKCGRTPLSAAAGKGHKEVVKLLLERADLNPDQPDTRYGQTPLSWAAEHGHEGVVKMLLEREDVNPDQPDTKYGRTPLSWAAEQRHEGVVKMLSE